MPSDKTQNLDLQPINNIDRTLHAPARLLILAILNVVENADFTFLLQQSGLTRGNLGTHVTKLEEDGYISIKKLFVERKPRTLFRLTNKGRKAIQTYRENMRHVIDNLLV
jgi:DNA-binding MarR family transcriptional regulator